jgi:phosphoribosylanthranilate isomerase
MGVDVSSGVEIPGAEGMKDDEAIRAFVENAGRKLDEGEA